MIARTFTVPRQFFIVILIGWVSREQQRGIELYRAQVEAMGSNRYLT